MLVLDGDLLPAVYFLSLFLLEQARFLEIQEANIFDYGPELFRHHPTAPFVSQHTYDAASSAERGFDCAICQVESIGRFEEVYSLHCKHQFHRWCLISWVDSMGNTAYTCPLCREPIQQPPCDLASHMDRQSLLPGIVPPRATPSLFVTEGPQENRRRDPQTQYHTVRHHPRS